MKFKFPLEKTKIIKRYKRFFADVEAIDGSVLTVHVPNTGPMRGAWETGWPCYVMKKENPKKLTHGAELTQLPSGALVGINTQNPNKIIKEALESGKIDSLKNYTEVKPEKKIGNSKIDFFLKGEGLPDCFVEVKNVSGDLDGIAFFPDTVSERALKHLKELQDIKEKGMNGVLIFLIQRNDCSGFRPGDEFHPEYGQELRKAIKNGLSVIAFSCQVSLSEISLGKQLPIILD